MDYGHVLLAMQLQCFCFVVHDLTNVVENRLNSQLYRDEQWHPLYSLIQTLDINKAVIDGVLEQKHQQKTQLLF